MTTTAFYLPAGAIAAGQRFCLLHEARNGFTRAAVVYVHPWAEEMNKSRRMAALQARALADAGCTVLQIDLLGCGDSSGDFRDASWEAWIDDVAHASQWLSARVDAPLWLWGLRAGCLLAAEASRALDKHPHFLFWQPVLSGKVALQQFLRLKTAAGLLGGAPSSGAQSADQLLAAGRSIDIAGYELTPTLARGFGQAVLQPPSTGGHVAWIEVSSRDEPSLSAASGAAVQSWSTAGYEVDAQAVKGPGFWQTVEIKDAPALIDATVSAITASVAI